MVQRDLKDGFKLEYQTLRDEVLLRFQLGVQLFGGTLAASALVLVYGFTPPTKPLIFLVGAFFNTITLYYLIEQQERIVFRINSYIRCFFESEETSLLWEIRSRAQQDLDKHQNFPFLGGNYQYTFCLLLIWINIVLFGYYFDPRPAAKAVVILAGTSIFFIIAAHAFRVLDRYRRGWGEVYDKDWQQIKKSEQAK